MTTWSPPCSKMFSFVQTLDPMVSFLEQLKLAGVTFRRKKKVIDGASSFLDEWRDCKWKGVMALSGVSSWLLFRKKQKKQVRQGLENIFVKKNKEVEGVIEFAAGNTEIDV